MCKSSHLVRLPNFGARQKYSLAHTGRHYAGQDDVTLLTSQSFIPTPELQCFSSGLCRPPSYLSYKASCVLWPDLYLCSHAARPPLPLVCYTGLLSVLQAYVFSHVLEVCLAPHLELERQTVPRWASYG